MAKQIKTQNEIKKTQKSQTVEMVVAVINRGYADFVVDAARDGGATGATIIYGRGTGTHSDAINGVKVETEKEVVLIVVKKSIRRKVMQEISDRTHLQENGNGITFSVPVTNVKGISHFVSGLKK